MTDGRLSLVYLTDHGREFVKEIDHSWEELHQTYQAILGQIESEHLSKEINAASEKLQKK